MLEKYTMLIECKKCEKLHLLDDRSENAYGETMCPSCKYSDYKITSSEVARSYWSVAVYDTGQAYGGPEEGGWYYTEGVITEYSKIKVFDDFKKANKYYNKLNKKGYYVIGYNDKFPNIHFPSIKPRYY